MVELSIEYIAKDNFDTKAYNVAGESNSSNPYFEEDMGVQWQQWYHDGLESFMLSAPIAVIPIHEKEREVLREISSLVIQRGFKERDTQILKDYAKNFTQTHPLLKNRQTRFMMRLDECSCKDVHDGFVVPYDSIYDFFIDVVQSRRALYWLSQQRRNPGCIIVSTWRDDVSMNREFRVFVYHGKVTAVSQYMWKTPLNWHVSRDTLAHIVTFTQNLFSNRLITLISAVVDVHVHDSGTVSLVEVGPFGLSYGSGSTLFHWDRDRDILESTGDKLICRLYQ